MVEPLPPRLRRWCLAASMACLLPLLLQVPSVLALGLALVAAIGIAVPRQLPSLVRLALALCVVGFVLFSHGFNLGRDTGCAVLAALLAVKPYETHHLRDARSLLGFSLFAPFAAMLQDQGPLTLALALPAVGLLLTALAMLAEHRPALSLRPPGPRLRLIGSAVLMSLPLALAAFWLFPRLGTPLWGLPENVMSRGGLSDRMTPDQWTDMFADDAPALRVVFDGPLPAARDRYWRAQVLWHFDGRSWTSGFGPGLGMERPVRAAPGVRTVDYEITMEPTDRHYLVTMDQPLVSPPRARMTNDLTVIAEEPVASIRAYRGRSASRTRQDGPLPRHEARVATALPDGLNPRTMALAAQWRRELGDDDERLVQRALDWISEDFSYSLVVPPSGRDAIDDFLFETRVGYCQQFSSSFAALMRAAGIPARVVLGYAGGYRNRYGGYWVVRRMDAHAWNEVWLDGRGWTRVDPTAAVAPERILDTVEDLAAAESLLPDTLVSLRDLGDWARRGWNELVLGFDAARQSQLLRPLGIRDAHGGQLAAAFSIGAGLALAVTLWILMRGRPPPRDPLLSAWQAFTSRMRRAGLEKAPAEPPSSFGERVAAALPSTAAEVRSLVQRFVAWRYAGQALDPPGKRRLATDLRAFRPVSRRG